MAINLAENLARTNPNQPIVFGSDLKGNAFPIDVLANTGSIPSGKREVGLVVFTSASGEYYGFTGDDVANWDTPSNWSEFVLSGAGGTDLSGTFSGSFSGSFEGNGSGLTNVDYSNLDNVPSGIVSQSQFNSTSQGVLQVEINGDTNDVDLGLETTDDVTFNQVTATTQVTANEVTASSAVRVGNYTITPPNGTSLNITQQLGDISFGTQNFLLGSLIFGSAVDVTSTKVIAVGNRNFRYASGSINSNTAIGTDTLQYISASDRNTAIGELAGTNSNLYLSGSNNTFIGYSASYTSDVTNATAIGYNTKVAQDNTVILGNSADVGIGTSTPNAKLDVQGNISGSGELQIKDGVGIGTPVITDTKLAVKGTGNTSATTALLVQNLGGTDLLKVLDNGHITLSNVTGSSFTGSFAGSFTGVTDLPNLTEGNNGITSFTYDGSSTATVALNTAGSTFTDGVKAKLNTEGVFSSSIQVDHDQTTNFVANEHIDHSSVSILSGDGMSGGGNIVSSQTLTLDTGSTHFNDGVKAKLNTETVVSSSAQVDFFNLNNLPGGIVSSSAQVDYDSISNVPGGIVSQSLLNDLTNGEVNQLKNIDGATITTTQWGYLGVLNQGLTTADSVVFRNGRFEGDLTVQGTVTSLQTEDLNVKDQFILLNSGSTEGDSGLIFGGGNTPGIAQQGPSLFWDRSYEGTSGNGRLAVTSSMAWNNTSPSSDYHLAGVFEGAANAAATANADQVGNIRVESGEIYIYA